MSGIRRIGRGKHPFIGRYVVAEIRTVRGGDGRYIEDWTRSLYPENQFLVRMHQRHPTGFDLVTGKINANVSPTCGFYKDLCAYGQFKWAYPDQFSWPYIQKRWE